MDAAEARRRITEARTRLGALGDEFMAVTGLRAVSYPAFCHFGNAIGYLELATEQCDHALAELRALAGEGGEEAGAGG